MVRCGRKICTAVIILLIALTAVIMMAGARVVYGDSGDVDKAGVPDRIESHAEVFDAEGLITPAEKAEIEAELQKSYDKYNVNAYVIITTNIGMSDDYEGYLERKWTSLPDRNSVILLIGFKSDDHVYIIRSYGEENAEKKLSTNRLQKIQDDMEADMKQYNFAEASLIYAKDVYKYLGKYDAVYDDNLFLKWWFDLLIIFVICTIIFMFSAMGAGQSDDVTPVTYLNRNKSRVVNGFDRYIRTSVSRVKINTDSGSRGGGGFSRGGGHSSGGRGF